MKHTILFAALGLVGFSAAAQEVGHVISSNPVVQQVAVPRQNCAPAYVQAPPQTSGMGGLAGALIGGGIGSQIGGGNGAIAGALLGTVGGAILGNNVEANNQRAQLAAVPNCITENTVENRTVGYDVTYEYAGRQYTTRMPYDPGATVRLSVNPVAQGSSVSAPPVQGIVATAPGTVVAAAPAPVYVQPYPAYPAYPAYAAYPYPVYQPYYYPPVGLSLGFVFRGGHGGGHRHWR
jgi:uncharacterized protein YcfJ